MGLNWAAALSNVADGMGKIAQVKYAEFMRQDEAKRREAEREIDFKRQQNLARFNVDAQRDLQSDSFAHTEKIENARIDAQKLRDQADSEYRMKSLSNQERQINASAASAAAQARSEGDRLKMLEDQAGYAKADRELQQQLSVWKIPLEAAQAEMNAVMAQRMEKIKQAPEGTTPDTSYEDGLIMEAKRKIDAAVDGQIGFMVDSNHIKMAPDVKERYLSVLSTAKEDGTFPSKIEAMQRANNPVLQAEPPPPDPNQFIPSGGNRGLPGQGGGATAPQAAPQAEAPQDDGPGFIDRTLGNMGEAASMAAKPVLWAADKVLGAGAAVGDYMLGDSPAAGPSKTDLEFAMKKLDARTIEKFKFGHPLTDFELQQIGELGYKQEDFRRLLQRGGYSP